ncbi:MAG: hypothetical protein LKF82_05320 [Acinetobacter populi]|jgi:hypothetical protein|uniref:hypothetical protein n=1 Tax=Acinetobacter populi TaxID=1582270 RepID=UPI002356BA07|nr:hypothetical protein [Acinetobacter populi]MCH4247245.1 hypothetical protein [Acinetobacter populi]
MNIQLKTVMIASTALLAMNITTAKTVSNSLTLQQGLNCLDWTKKEQSFTNQLVMGERGNMAQYGMASINQQFKQQYSKQKSKVVNDPDDENFCDDCPETVVYLPKKKNNSINRIETLMQVSAIGMNTKIYRNGDLQTTKQMLEKNANIKFNAYTEQQYKKFRTLSNTQNLPEGTDLRAYSLKLYQQYPDLKVFKGYEYKNGKLYSPKNIFIVTKSYKSKTPYGMGSIAYLILYDNPMNSSQHIMECGYSDDYY